LEYAHRKEIVLVDFAYLFVINKIVYFII